MRRIACGFCGILLILINSILSQAWSATTASDAIDQSMARLWAGQAKFESYLQLQIETNGPVVEAGDRAAHGNGMDMGTQIVPLNGVWYMFNREYNYEPKPPECRRDHARVVVRKSLDQGRSWSSEAVVATPDLARGECAVADGSAFWDAETGTWHYLSQVLAAARGWNMNHYTRRDADPLGPFAPDPDNPVVRGGELWLQICGLGKICPAGTHDEGTPDIAQKRNGYFFVTFHGAFGRPPIGFRGVAETKDFHRWVINAPDLPGDAIWSSRDCQAWAVKWDAATGCVGGGAASMLVTPRYMYMVIESADVSLNCRKDQHWEFGLVRAPRFVKSGNWQQFPKNPLLLDTRTTGCSLQYAQLFNDGVNVYLSYWTFDNTPRRDLNTIFYIEKLR